MVQETNSIYSNDLINIVIRPELKNLRADVQSEKTYLNDAVLTGIGVDAKFNTYTNNLLNEVNTVIDQNDEKYFRGEEGNNLQIDSSEHYYSNKTGDDADEEIKRQMKGLDNIRKVMGDENGKIDVTELKMKSNRFHYFTFFFTFIIIIIYTVKVFTNSKNNTVETLILIVASLIVLYYLVNFIMEYLRKRH